MALCIFANNGWYVVYSFFGYPLSINLVDISCIRVDNLSGSDTILSSLLNWDLGKEHLVAAGWLL